MTGLRMEGTEFQGGRCAMCGRDGYGMAEDGPRCYGCERVVLRDDSADNRTPGLDYPPSVAPFERIRAAWDRAFFGEPAPSSKQQRKRRQSKLKEADVLAEVDMILKEARS